MSSDYSPMGHDSEYWSRRESEERLAAEQSSDPAARAVHTTLADGYAERLRAAMPVVS